MRSSALVLFLKMDVLVAAAASAPNIPLPVSAHKFLICATWAFNLIRPHESVD
jgi:hypothetical protein